MDPKTCLPDRPVDLRLSGWDGNQDPDWSPSASAATVVFSMTKPVRIPVLLVALTTALVSGSVAYAQEKPPAKEPDAPVIRQFQPPRQLQGGGVRLRLGGGIQAQDILDLRAIRSAAIPTEIHSLVDALASDDFPDRIDAMLALREHPADDHCLMAVLENGTPLLEEQRLRLLSAIEWRILNRPRGAVGIRMMPRTLGMRPAGIEVQEVIAGLPAERVLRVGDVLVRLDDKVVFENQELILHVQQMRPGEKISVDLLRPVVLPPNAEVPDRFVEGDQGQWFEPIEVELTLGSFEQLGEDRGNLNAETSRRELYVERVRGEWGDPPKRRVVRAPVPDAIRPATKRR